MPFILFLPNIILYLQALQSDKCYLELFHAKML